MWFFRSPRIVFGEDSLSFLSMVESRRFLIVTDRFLAGTGILEKVKAGLPQGAETMVFSKIGPEPLLSEMTSDMDSIYRFRPEIIIGLGGGSSIDAAKIIYALYEKPGLSAYDITPIDNFVFVIVPYNFRQIKTHSFSMRYAETCPHCMTQGMCKPYL